MGVLIWFRHMSKVVILSMKKLALASLLIISCSTASAADLANAVLVKETNCELSISQTQNCSTSSLNNRPSWGACSIEDIQRLGYLQSQNLPAYSSLLMNDVYSLIAGASPDKKRRELYKLLPEIKRFEDLNKLHNNLSKEYRSIWGRANLSQDLKLNLEEKARSNYPKDLFENLQAEKSRLFERAQFISYSYCLVGLRAACETFIDKWQTHSLLINQRNTPAFCDLKKSPASNFTPERSFYRLSVTELLREPALNNKNGPVYAYAKLRSRNPYISDLKSGMQYLPLVNELLKALKASGDQGSSRQQEISRALIEQTNGYFQYEFTDFFSVAETSCLKWSSPEACYQLARSHRFGIQTPENHFMARDYFQRSVELKPKYFWALSELASMQLEFTSPVFDSLAAMKNLELCESSIYCPVTLGFLYASKLFPDPAVPLNDRFEKAIQLWQTSVPDKYSARMEKSKFEGVVASDPNYDFAYSSPNFNDDIVFKAAISGHKKAQLLLAQGFSGSVASNLVYSPKLALVWALMAEQDFGEGLSLEDKKRLREVKSKVGNSLSGNDLQYAHSQATEIARHALEVYSQE